MRYVAPIVIGGTHVNRCHNESMVNVAPVSIMQMGNVAPMQCINAERGTHMKCALTMQQ